MASMLSMLLCSTLLSFLLFNCRGFSPSSSLEVAGRRAVERAAAHGRAATMLPLLHRSLAAAPHWPAQSAVEAFRAMLGAGACWS